MKSAPSANWFSTWFGTTYYDLLYGHRDDMEAALLVRNVLGHLKPVSDACILDAACGKGRHAILFAEKGYTVTGIDLSYKNIREAQQYAKENLTFFQHDMRKPFCINYFDLICNFYTSFGYFDDPADDVACLRSFASGLKPGGQLVIDFLNINQLQDQPAEDVNKVIQDVQFTISKHFSDGFIHKNIQVLDNGVTMQYTEKVRALDKKSFEDYFKQSGLQLKEVFGNYRFEPFDVHTSDRLILIAIKS